MTPAAAQNVLVLAYVALATVFAIFCMRTFAATRMSRRAGAEAPLSADVAEIKARLAAVETMLREVG